MKIIILFIIGAFLSGFCTCPNLYGQCEIKITGKTCKGTVLTANSKGGNLTGLEWKRDGKIVDFSRKGVTVAGGHGEGNGANQLDEPTGVFVDDYGNLWVADTRNGRIQKFKPGCTIGVTIGANLPNAPTFPTNLFVSSDGAVYVADFFESRVKRLAKNGYKWIDVAGQHNEMHLTRGVWVDKYGNVFCTDCGHSRVLKYAPHSSVGVVVAGGNGYGNALNQLANPASVVLDNEENIYIADENNHRVVKWAPGAKCGVVVAGNTLLNDARTGPPLHNPVYVSVHQEPALLDNSNKPPVTLYISDKATNSVQLWLEGAAAGTLVAGGNGRGDQPDQLNRPFANYIAGNHLFVADRDNARIQRFDLSYSVNNQFTAMQAGNYSANATFDNGCIIVSNSIRVTESCNELLVTSSANASNVLAKGNSNNIFAYPNPAKNLVTINFSAKQNGKYIF